MIKYVLVLSSCHDGRKNSSLIRERGVHFMRLLEYRPGLLLPHSRQFPFDATAEKIVRALEKRNWEVSGMEVEFSTYGRGLSKHTYVQKIEGDDFYLKFHRPQGILPDV